MPEEKLAHNRQSTASYLPKLLWSGWRVVTMITFLDKGVKVSTGGRTELKKYLSVACQVIYVGF